MMFVVKGAVNLVNNEIGELAIVSYQGTQGTHSLSFFFNKEEVMSDFKLSYSEVVSLERKPKEILSYDVNTYLRITEDTFEIVDLNVYTKEDKASIKPYKRSVTECENFRQRIGLHRFELPNLDLSVRAKSHMRQYQDRGIKLAMHLALENPIKYNEVDLIPVDNYYADYEAMADIVYLDYTIQDYTQPVKSVEELNEEHNNEVDQPNEEEYLQDDELEEIVEQYEEESIDDEEDEDEVEMDIEEPPTTRKKDLKRRSPLAEVQDIIDENVKPVKEKVSTTTQPRTKDGKFAPKKKKK